jgi:hypothetical protein
MANIPSNHVATVISGSGSTTGSFLGFTVAQAVTFTGLRDANNGLLASGTSTLTFPTGVTVPLTVTSASISAGAVIFYI